MRRLDRVPSPKARSVRTPRSRVASSQVLRARASRRLELQALFGLCTLGSGCRCSADPPAPAKPPVPAVVADCRLEGAELTLAPSRGDGVSPGLPDADLDPSVELPFAVESGTAVALGGRFFVSALRHEPHGGVALLGRVDARRGAPAPGVNTVLELAKLDGEVPPARLATDGEDLIVALETPRPSGFQIRVARLARADLSLPLVWQDGPELSRGESNTFDVAAADGRTLIAWDDWPPQSKLGRVFVALLEPGTDARVVPRAVSPADADAEEPRIVPRPNGYWIAWLVNARAGENPTRVYDPGEAETDAPTPAAPPASGRWVELLALDATGHPVGRVRRITGGKERVVGYDLANSAGGDAWIGWRQDASSAGAPGGRILFAEARAEGTAKVVAVREGDVGSGEPIWLALPPPSGGNVAAELASPLPNSAWLTLPWLTFPDQRDRTVLLPITLSPSAPAKPGTPLALGAELEGATALASIDGQLLFAQPQGRAVRLISAHCNPVAAATVLGADAGVPQP